MAAPKGIVFDLDDTLADTFGTLVRPAQRAAVRAMIDAGLRAAFDPALAALEEIRAADPAAPFARLLAERFGADDPEGCATAGRRAYFGNRPDGIALVPGAAEVLDDLRSRGVRLFLVTFGVVEAQERKIALLGLRDRFEAVRVVPFEEGEDKTAALSALLADDVLAPDEVWVVGDRPPGEIRAANQLGIFTVRVRRGEFEKLDPASPGEEADVTIRRLSELPSLFA